jgi:hypothetical protein
MRADHAPVFPSFFRPLLVQNLGSDPDNNPRRCGEPGSQTPRVNSSEWNSIFQ